jgi:hypothetical protein
MNYDYDDEHEVSLYSSAAGGVWEIGQPSRFGGGNQREVKRGLEIRSG